MVKQLVRDYFGHKAGESVTVLSYAGSGRYRVKFADGTTDTIGASILSQ